jgi:thiol:disulfide interchange protein DsbD
LLAHLTGEVIHQNGEIAGTVKWVVCREVCIPGTTEVTLSLPVKHSPAAPPDKIFDAARRLVPEPLPARWHARARAEKNDFVLSIETGQPIAQTASFPVFFPLEARQIENAAPQVVSALPQCVQLRLKKSEQLLKPIAVLRGVVVLPSGKAYVIDAPVTGAGGSGKQKTGK